MYHPAPLVYLSYINVTPNITGNFVTLYTSVQAFITGYFFASTPGAYIQCTPTQDPTTPALCDNVSANIIGEIIAEPCAHVAYALNVFTMCPVGIWALVPSVRCTSRVDYWSRVGRVWCYSRRDHDFSGELSSAFK